MPFSFLLYGRRGLDTMFMELKYVNIIMASATFCKYFLVDI
ncbi:hypothetical protein DCCM_3707 [Desulfocucumis palustris]|uniref:Uncharacterized protein n=1 Tax=Desulfocucumis palustris TaxID=1898651 RepID=A0A2L2XED4_9FIRM|nr:hypothetical protein DCCM_3707 [Desulfocucumis palustris]